MEGVNEVRLALVVGQVEVGNVQQWRQRAQHAPAVAVNRHQWNLVQAVAAAFGELDDVFAQRVQVVAARVDHPHLLDLLLAKVVQRAGRVLVDADLRKRRARHGARLAPAPDLWGIHVDEVRAAALCTLLGQVPGAHGAGVVHQYGAVAVGEAADQRTTRIFIDVGADAVDVVA